MVLSFFYDLKSPSPNVIFITEWLINESFQSDTDTNLEDTFFTYHYNLRPFYKTWIDFSYIYTFGIKTNLFLMYRYKNRGHYLSQTMPSPNQLKVITSYICVNIFSTYHDYYFKPQGSKCGNFWKEKLPFCGPSRAWTYDLQIMSLLLWPTEL